MKKVLFLFAAVACALTSWAEDVVTAQYSNNTLDVNLTNETNFVAFQMDIAIPAGVTNEGIKIQSNTSRLAAGSNVLINGQSETTDFKVLSNIIEGNKLRVIAYNLGNNAIAGTNGDKLFTVTLNTPFQSAATISNILFVDENLVEKSLTDAVASGAGTTQIDAVDMTVGEGAQTYDLQGRRVVNAKNGVYVVNGKKQIVK